MTFMTGWLFCAYPHICFASMGRACFPLLLFAACAILLPADILKPGASAWAPFGSCKCSPLHYCACMHAALETESILACSSVLYEPWIDLDPSRKRIVDMLCHLEIKSADITQVQMQMQCAAVAVTCTTSSRFNANNARFRTLHD
jgi:hypothetical protein